MFVFRFFKIDCCFMKLGLMKKTSVFHFFKKTLDKNKKIWYITVVQLAMGN